MRRAAGDGGDADDDRRRPRIGPSPVIVGGKNIGPIEPASNKAISIPVGDDVDLADRGGDAAVEHVPAARLAARRRCGPDIGDDSSIDVIFRN